MEFKRQWRFHPGARSELDGLPANGKQGLAELMGRLKRDEPILPRERVPLGDGLFALKYSEAHNEFRCYYSHEGKFGQVLLGVGFDYKKTEKADLAAARQRLKTWRAEGKAAAKGRPGGPAGGSRAKRR